MNCLKIPSSTVTESANPRRTARDVRSRFREIDRRLADVETYVTSSNSRLAREIEQLR